MRPPPCRAPGGGASRWVPAPPTGGMDDLQVVGAVGEGWGVIEILGDGGGGAWPEES